MNKKWHGFLALGLCAVMLIGCLAACAPKKSMGSEEGETTLVPPAEDTGLTLNLFQPHPTQAALWQELAADYKTLTGVDVAVHSPTTSAPATELKEALKGEQGVPALFLFTNPREYKAWQDNAADLAETRAGKGLVDSRLAMHLDGKTIGLPLGVEAYGIIYNKRVLEKYFELEEKKTDLKTIADVKNYTELEALVKDLDANKTALGLDGVFAAPAFKEGESTAWSTRLLSVPMGYEIDKNHIEITGDGINEMGLKYETGYKAFTDLHFSHGTTKEALENRTYADAAKEFAAGKAAMILGSTDFLGHLNSAVGQTVNAEDTAFLPVFMDISDVKNQGLAFESVEFIAVNGKRSEEEVKAANEFVDWLFTSERGMDFLANRLNVIAPYDTVTAEALPQNPLSASAFEWLKKDGVTNDVTWSILTPGEEFRDKVMGTGLLKYSRGETKWEDFKADLKKGWKEHREKIDETF